jgi:hypothetical protein
MHKPLLPPPPNSPQEITLALISVKVNSFCKYRQGTYKRYIETLSCNHCSSGKAMRVCAILSSVACLVLSIFSHYLTKAARFFGGKKRLVTTKCVIWFSLQLLFWNISHAKKNSARYDQHFILVFIWSIRFSGQILMKLQFWRQIFENPQICISIKIRPVGAELSHGNGRTDRQTHRHDESTNNSHFSQYCERSYKYARNSYTLA